MVVRTVDAANEEKGKGKGEIESSLPNFPILKVEMNYRGEKRNMGSKIKLLIKRQKILTEKKFGWVSM